MAGDGPVKGWVGSLPLEDNGPGDYPSIGPKFWIILIIDRFLEIGPSMVWLWGGLGRSGCDSVEILRWNVRDVIVIATITTIHGLTQIKQWPDDLNSNVTSDEGHFCPRALTTMIQIWSHSETFGIVVVESERMLLSSPKIFTESPALSSSLCAPGAGI